MGRQRISLESSFLERGKAPASDFETGWKGDPSASLNESVHTDFIGAVKYGCDYAGIAFDRQGKQEDPAARRAREAEQARQRAKREAEHEADEGRRIAYARAPMERQRPDRWHGRHRNIWK